MREIRSPVPSGTVLLVTMIAPSVIRGARVDTAASTPSKLASPAAPVGVSTAMKMNSRPGIASA